MRFILICIGIICLAPTSVWGQKDTSTLDDRSFEIVGGQFDPKLQKAEKITTVPTSDPIDTKAPVFNYDISKHQASTKRVATPLSPLKYRSKEKEDWRGNYFKLGYGNFNMPLAEAYLFNLKDDQLIYGAEIKHLSANKAKSFQDFSQNTVKLYGARILKNNQFTINLAYDRNSIRRYGFDSADFGFDKERVLRNFEDWNGSFRFNRLRGKKKAPKIGFLLDYHSFATSDRSNETSFEGVIDFRMRAFEGEILADLGVMHSKLSTINHFQERVFLNFFPRYTFKHPTEDLDITAGLKVNYVPAGVDSTLLIFPHIQGRYHLIKDYVVIFGGFTGGMDRNLLRTQVYTNPFINDTFVQQSTINNYAANLGFEGKLTKNLEFLGEISISNVENLALNITSSDSFNSFNTVYADGDIISFRTQLGYTFSTKVRAYLIARVNDYALTQKAWQLPTSEVRMRVQYNIAKKIYTTAEAIYWGARDQTEVGQPSGTMDGFFDFNLHFDYRHRKHLSFFADFNNITSSKIQRWYNHPVYALNILAGVNFSF